MNVRDKNEPRVTLYNKKNIFFSLTVGLDPMVLKKNRALTEDFTKLYLEIEKEGMFVPSYTHNILRVLELVVMGAIGYALVQCESNIAKVIGSILIGLMQGRSGWMQHEGGHNSLSGKPKIDRILHAFFFGKLNTFYFIVLVND